MPGAPFHAAAYAMQGLITLSNEIERALARLLGVNLTDYRALSALSASGAVTVSKLAEELGATPATTTAILNRLESRGLVERRRADADRRQVHVSVTTDGLQRILTLMGPLMAATNDYIWSLPPDEQRVVMDFFSIAQEQMRVHLAALSSVEA